MKKLIVVCAFLVLVGCDVPPPMSDAEAAAFQACLALDKKPRFAASGARRDFTCEK